MTRQTVTQHVFSDVVVVPLTSAVPDLIKIIEVNLSEYGQYSPRDKVKARQVYLLKLLQEIIPEYIDETVIPDKFQAPNLNYLSYVVPINKGFCQGSIEFEKDLGIYLKLNYHISDTERKRKLADGMSGIGGVIIKKKVPFYIGACDGDNQENSLNIMGVNIFKDDDGCGARVIDFIINMLGSGLKIDKFDVEKVTERGNGEKSEGEKQEIPFIPISRGVNHFFWGESINVYDIMKVYALINDSTLGNLRQADAPVGEFLEWMSEHKTDIASLINAGQIAAYLSQKVKRLGSHHKKGNLHEYPAQLLQSALEESARRVVEKYNELRPPVNNRLDYLAR